MQVVVLVTFALVFGFSIIRPGLAVASAVTMFPVEQMLQGYIDYLRSTRVGLLLVNVIVLATSALCVIRSSIRMPRPFLGFLNPSMGMVIGLLIWSVLSIAWSPSKEKALASVAENTPYILLLVGMGGFLLHDLRSLDSFCRSLLLIATAASLFVLISPEFVNRWGRLGFAIGFENERSNPLALGELGGVAMIAGLLLRDQKGRFGLFWNLLRLTGMGVGLALGIQSGSRGQVIFAVVVAAFFFPVAAPVKDVRRFILTLLGLGTLGGATLILMNTLLYGFEAQRFTLDELLYGQSSTQGRAQNVLVLVVAWAKNPFFWIFGLGYYAFSDLYSAKTDPYSHVLIADAIFELGIPGIALLGGLMIRAGRDYYQLFGEVSNRPAARAAVAILGALACYYVLLVNKQGYLWGSGIFFLLMSAPARLLARMTLDPDLNVVALDEGAHESLDDESMEPRLPHAVSQPSR